MSDGNDGNHCDVQLQLWDIMMSIDEECDKQWLC